KLQDNVLSQFTGAHNFEPPGAFPYWKASDSCWVEIGTADQVAPDFRGALYFTEGSTLLKTTGVVGGGFFAACQTVAAGISTCGLDANGKAYYLQPNGDLCHEGLPVVGHSVTSFIPDQQGKAYFLQSNGDLWHEGPGLVAHSVASFVLDRDGK